MCGWSHFFSAGFNPHLRLVYMLAELLRSGLSFFRHTVGIIISPYQTYRDIEKRGRTAEMVYIGLLVGLYFSLSSVVKIASFHPLLLSRYAFVLFASALSGFGFIVSALVVTGRLLGRQTSVGRISLLWAYTLIPTVVWFLFTSLLYVAIPPPRTTQITGVLLSIVYLVVSAMIFWWKLTLSYLTLRFGLKIDFRKILIVALAILPVLVLWTYAMYTLGVFKVPFL